jgi:hypothetical protein
MSSRVLRKLGLQTEKDLIIPGDEASDTEADFSSGGTKKKLNLNRYDLVSLILDFETSVSLVPRYDVIPTYFILKKKLLRQHSFFVLFNMKTLPK